MKTYLCALVIGFILTAVSFPTILVSQHSTPITEEQAIQIAEKFVIDNGYTDLPPDSSRIQKELFDNLASGRDEVLKRRHNRLNKKPYCICDIYDRWCIGFVYSNYDTRSLDSNLNEVSFHGKILYVWKNGLAVRFEHRTLIGWKWKKL